MGIEQGGFRGDVHRGADGRDAEFYDVFRGESGMDLDEAVVGSETFFMHFEAIHAKGEIADNGESEFVGGETAVKLGRVAGEIDGGLDGPAVRAGDFQAQFPCIALRQERESEQKDREVEKWAHC